MKRILPPEIYQIKNWLLAIRRFDDATKVSQIIERSEKELPIDGVTAYWLKSILEEYCHAHNLTPRYRRTEADDLFDRLQHMKRQQQRRR